MMYCVNKAIGFVISPIGIAIVGGLTSIFFARRKNLGLSKCIGGITVVWLWLWMTPIMAWVVGVPLEREFMVNDRVPAVDTFADAEAIVLLGGSMGIETNMSSYAEMWTSADRVWQTVRLYKAKKAPTIIATGNHAKDSTLPLLKDFGIPEDSVSFLDARTTEEEAKGIEKLGYKRILLVTSAWHMNRARLMFKKYASEIEVLCAPADFEMSMMARHATFFHLILPDYNAFALNSVAFHEWVGIVGYSIFR